MEDDDLAAIRARRMAELQKNAPQSSDAGNAQQNEERAQQQRQQQEEMRNNILFRLLTQDARARLETLALAKPEKTKMVENLIVQMAQSGQIRSRLTEEQFRSILEQVSAKSEKKTTVKFERRRAALDSDED